MGKKPFKIIIIILSCILFLEAVAVGGKMYIDQKGIELFPKAETAEDVSSAETDNASENNDSDSDVSDGKTSASVTDEVKAEADGKYTYEDVKNTNWSESMSEEEYFLKAVAWIQEKPNVASVDFSQEQYFPNGRNASLVWDGSALDRLTSLNPFINDIRGYTVADYSVDDIEANASMSCITLTNIETGYIEKIIAQESVDGRDMLTYYFFDGPKLCYVIDSRSNGGTQEYENKYSYAADTLVGLEMKKGDGSVETYDARNYGSYSAAVRSEYDAMEKYMLNRAYILCASVNQAGPAFGAIRGYVKDSAGNPIVNAKVEVYAEQFDAVAADRVTDDYGFYTCNVPLISESYTVKITNDGNNVEEYSVNIDEGQKEYMSPTIVLK